MLLFWNSIWKGEKIMFLREMWQCLTQRDLVLNLKIRAGNSGSLLHIMTSVYIFSESICKQSIWVLFLLPIAPTNCYHQPAARQFWNKWNSSLLYASFFLLPLLQQMSSGNKTPFKLSMWIYHLGLWVVFLTKKINLIIFNLMNHIPFICTNSE